MNQFQQLHHPPLTIDTKDYMLLGDLNFHLDDPTGQNSTNLLDSLESIGLNQLTQGPTYTSGHTLDPIFTSSNKIRYSNTTQLTWTDHYSIHFSISTPHTYRPKVPTTPRHSWKQ